MISSNYKISLINIMPSKRILFWNKIYELDIKEFYRKRLAHEDLPFYMLLIFCHQ